PWLALTFAGAQFTTETVQLTLGRLDLTRADDVTDDERAVDDLANRRKMGSAGGLFPVLHVDGIPIHESLAICEWVNEAYPEAQLWPHGALARAQARAIATEMATSFTQMRTHLSCHLFGRVPRFTPNAGTRREIARVFEIWSDALGRSAGPFLFGSFGIADAMYFPVRTRFQTYGVPIPAYLDAYVRALDDLPAV